MTHVIGERQVALRSGLAFQILRIVPKRIIKLPQNSAALELFSRVVKRRFQ